MAHDLELGDQGGGVNSKRERPPGAEGGEPGPTSAAGPQTAMPGDLRTSDSRGADGLNRESARRRRGPLVWWLLLNLLALGLYFTAGSFFGELSHASSLIYSSPDTLGYQEVGEWIFGERPETAFTRIRPFFYPLLLTSSVHLLGSNGPWLLNVVFWLAGANLAGGGLLLLTGRRWAGVVIFLLIASNLSLMALTYFAISDVTTLFLACLWLYASGFFAQGSRWLSPWSTACLTGVLALLTVTRPVHQAFCLAFVLGYALLLTRNRARLASYLGLVVGLLPVFAQGALVWSQHDMITLSTIGEDTFHSYYFPLLYAAVETPEVEVQSEEQWRAIARRTSGISRRDQWVYVMRHLPKAARTFVGTSLGENLMEGCNIGYDSRRAPLRYYATKIFNIVAFVFHVYALPLIALAALQRRVLPFPRFILIMQWLGFALVALSSGVTFLAGDRIIITALPLWGAAYLGAVIWLLPVVRAVRSTTQSTP